MSRAGLGHTGPHGSASLLNGPPLMPDNPPRPKARSQHEPLLANPQWPHWGRDPLDHGHAIYAIAAHLRTLGLESWFIRLARWLSHYDGFEHYVEEGHDPCISVRDLLASYVTRWRTPTTAPAAAARPGGEPALKNRVLEDILRLDFIYYRAYWGRGLIHEADARVWNPLAQPWMHFLEIGRPGEELLSWRALMPPRPTLAEHRAVLLAN